MSRQDRGPGAPPRRGGEFLLRIGKITDEGADAPSLRFRFRCCHVLKQAVPGANRVGVILNPEK